MTLENYADLEVAVLDEQDGLDPEDNGDGDDSVEEEGVDEKGGDEEKVTCTKCEKECILDFVFELRNVIEDDEKEKLENIIEEKKKEFLESKENENDDSDDEEVELLGHLGVSVGLWVTLASEDGVVLVNENVVADNPYGDQSDLDRYILDKMQQFQQN